MNCYINTKFFVACIFMLQIHLDSENKEKSDDKGEEICDEKAKKSSPAWDYFVKIPGCPVGKEKAKCSLCNVVIGCFSRNGTSAMMNHLKTVCPKSPLRTNLDKLQKTLRFEKGMDKKCIFC